MGYKKDFKDMSPNLVTYSGIFLLLWLFPPGYGWFLLAVLTPFVVKDLVYLKKGKAMLGRSYYIGLFKTATISSVFYLVVRLLGRYGWVGVLVVVFGFSGYKLFIARSYYMDKIREIEIMIWGKTNDRKKK